MGAQMPRKAFGDRPMTNAEKQARRREQFRLMRDAWEEVRTVRTAKEAREIAERVIAALGKVSDT